MLEKVVFSERAITALLTETRSHVKTETGGICLGHRQGKLWYITEIIDPGIDAIFRPDYFEYDDKYLNHLMGKVARLYEKLPEIIGLWHRHPGSMDVFSRTDDHTNTKYAQRNSEGAISMLVNIDPSLRLTVYHVTYPPLSYRKVSYAFGDNHFPPGLLAYASMSDISSMIERNEGKKNYFTSSSSFIRSAAGFSFSKVIKNYLNEDKVKNEHRIGYCISSSEPIDEELDTILAVLEEDINYFSEAGIKITLTLLKHKGLELKDTCGDFVAVMFIHNDKVFFSYDGNIYLYSEGFFRNACEYYTLYGKALY